ncbi:hypothetical protein [Arcobacter sp. YIC-310]|uniref:hypothetical protein n=1 Tax=Arcobacter sp. YIC-310 TaxID=3376632 RepID=UPI003C19DCEA
MSNIFKIFFSIIFIFVFTGCLNKEVTIQNKETTKKTIEEKKVEKSKSIIKIKKPTYKYCNKHRKNMLYAKNYILNEFEKAYFSKKDIIGAKAQLFLVQSNSPSVFAKNMNAAIKAYDKNYTTAKKNECNLKKYKTHPISSIKSKIKNLEGELKR